MDPLTVAVGGLALAVIANGVLWFFKSPNQQVKELAEHVAILANKLEVNEAARIRLEMDFIRSSVSLGVKVEQLGVEVSKLTTAVNHLTRRIDRGAPRDDSET